MQLYGDHTLQCYEFLHVHQVPTNQSYTNSILICYWPYRYCKTRVTLLLLVMRLWGQSPVVFTTCLLHKDGSI